MICKQSKVGNTLKLRKTSVEKNIIRLNKCNKYIHFIKLMCVLRILLCRPSYTIYQSIKDWHTFHVIHCWLSHVMCLGIKLGIGACCVLYVILDMWNTLNTVEALLLKFQQCDIHGSSIHVLDHLPFYFSEMMNRVPKGM